MTRIISGRAGSVRLDVPASGTRPTSDRVRESIFSALEAAALVSGARVLDLYAGSGALGLEAISRGAASVDLVEKAPQAATIIAANAARVRKAVGAAAEIRVHRRAVDAYLATARGAWDLVFIDPPYDLSATDLATCLDRVGGLLADGGRVVVERASRSEPPHWPHSLAPLREKRYGDTTVWHAAVGDSDDQPRPRSQS
ncbi:MAG: 16S rRNA (guanine(966)-N(2))-methyltransferase RsmD [Microbacterium sp. SCN 70-18]|uniref:16S rRNA (guanine(966)-N(2))-methyltransferase RsmD n=1 Tax=Microbacterium aurantiacum TaxID=162393 RepID=UPI00086E5B31|nr:MAG: 16S rRNA (guanine(966)-N(2))-methyltransferase RsmD [Microbacterium sp. SCN 70-18]